MASLPYPRCPPNSSHRTNSKFACASPPTDFTDAHRSFACTVSSHGIHGIHRSFWRRRASHRCAQMYTDFSSPPVVSGVEGPPTDAHRCTQIFLLRQLFLCVPRILWENSLVAAWVWQGCHTLLICAHLCNLWENILRQKLLWVLWLLWGDSLVAA